MFSSCISKVPCQNQKRPVGSQGPSVLKLRYSNMGLLFRQCIDGQILWALIPIDFNDAVKRGHPCLLGPGPVAGETFPVVRGNRTLSVTLCRSLSLVSRTLDQGHTRHIILSHLLSFSGKLS